jgi:5-methylcytosine-specific restriction protein A
VVDHIKPHRGDMTLFWDPNNHQPACDECHNIKTAREDGAFGNKPRDEDSGRGRGVKSL